MPSIANKSIQEISLNEVVSLQFDKAAKFLKYPQGLLQQIKACNSVYRMEFPVRFGDKYEIFYAYRVEHSQHKKPVKGVFGEDPFARCTELMKLYGVSACVVEQLPERQRCPPLRQPAGASRPGVPGQLFGRLPGRHDRVG